MSRQHHDLHSDTKFFQLVEKGIKKFELRLNDRNFSKGDIINIIEYVKDTPTGRRISNLEIKYIFYGGMFGLSDDYVIFNW